MYIENHLRPRVTPSLLYAEQTHALIVKTNEELSKDNLLGVYIPKLMFGLPIKNGAYEKTVSIGTSKILNSKNKNIGGTSMNIKNYVTLHVLINPNINMPKYVCGENVIVDFADRDIKSAYILPYSYGDTNRRRTDIITLFVNNFKVEDEIPDTHNIYAIQLDTKNQVASIFTSDPNGEKGIYTFAINARDGSILISDSGKRKIQIKTDPDVITMINEAKSEITMTGTVIDMKADILNIDMKSEINMKTSRITRKADTIETTATKDTEKVNMMDLKGNDYKLTYNNQTLKGNLYSNTTSIHKVTCPLSGFSGLLTVGMLAIFPVPGIPPPPTVPTVAGTGIATFGNPSGTSLPLAVAPHTLAALVHIASKLDALLASHGMDASASGKVSDLSKTIISKAVKG
jgi:hypothetical protein